MYNVVLTYEFVDESMTIQMKATEQYFPVVLFIMLYKVVLTFEIVNEVSIQMKATGQHRLLLIHCAVDDGSRC